jgi:hypothetical protein
VAPSSRSTIVQIANSGISFGHREVHTGSSQHSGCSVQRHATGLGAVISADRPQFGRRLMRARVLDGQLVIVGSRTAPSGLRP